MKQDIESLQIRLKNGWKHFDNLNEILTNQLERGIMEYILDESCFSEAERILEEHHEKFKKQNKRCTFNNDGTITWLKESENKNQSESVVLNILS